MRTNKLNAIFAEKDIDAIVIKDGCNIRYFSGFTGATGYLYISKKRAVVLTDARYTTQAREEAPGFQVEDVKAERNYAALIQKLLIEDQALAVGFEDYVLLYAEFSGLRETCNVNTWIPLGSSLEELRMVKEHNELAAIAAAQAIADKAFSHILTIIKPGIAEKDIALELEYYMRKNGAEGISFEPIAASGVHSAMPHATPSGKELEYGDFLTMDFGCKVAGYCSDMTRTVVIGKANERQREVYHTVLRAQQAGLEAVTAGCPASEADKAAREVIAEAGYGEYFGHSLGHGVGLFIHESPRLSSLDDTILRENMVVRVEPGIYIPGFGGVRIEDIGAVTDGKIRNFTCSPKELIEISC